MSSTQPTQHLYCPLSTLTRSSAYPFSSSTISQYPEDIYLLAIPTWPGIEGGYKLGPQKASGSLRNNSDNQIRPHLTEDASEDVRNINQEDCRSHRIVKRHIAPELPRSGGHCIARLFQHFLTIGGWWTWRSSVGA